MIKIESVGYGVNNASFICIQFGRKFEHIPAFVTLEEKYLIVEFARLWVIQIICCVNVSVETCPV